MQPDGPRDDPQGDELEAHLRGAPGGGALRLRAHRLPAVPRACSQPERAHHGADEVVIPIQTQFFALRGMSKLIEIVIRLVKPPPEARTSRIGAIVPSHRGPCGPEPHRGGRPGDQALLRRQGRRSTLDPHERAPGGGALPRADHPPVRPFRLPRRQGLPVAWRSSSSAELDGGRGRPRPRRHRRVRTTCLLSRRSRRTRSRSPRPVPEPAPHRRSARRSARRIRPANRAPEDGPACRVPSARGGRSHQEPPGEPAAAGLGASPAGVRTPVHRQCAKEVR